MLVLRKILSGLRPPVSGAGSHLLRVFLFFLAFLFLLALYARTISSRDPGSAFFKPWTAYDASYSSVRAQEADLYIESVNNTTQPTTHKASLQPGLCVGIASIARHGVRYFKTTVGTILEGLSEEERAGIHLRSLETDSAKASGREKDLFDYTYLKTCEGVDAPYTLMLEDDVFALDGWYHRTRGVLASAEKQTEDIGASKWLYLRLFYTEELLGWNSEEWPIYLFYSILVVLLVACTCLGIRQYSPRSAPHLSNETILLLSAICTPLVIGLFFATGRATMLPIPDGVHQMPRFGCCSQAFVFPQSRIPDLMDLYERQRLGYVDMLTEEYANDNQEIRWAVTPVVMQHAGRRSSKGMNNDPYVPLEHKSKGEMTEVEKLWNFRFEMQDVEALRAEHDFVNEYGLDY